MIALGSDFAGQPLKQAIMAHLEAKGIPCTDLGAYTTENSDYPIYGMAVAKAVTSGEYKLGLLFCGSGIGISLAANKVHGARCACCSEAYSAAMARQHNDANILAMGARVVGTEVAKCMVDAFLTNEYLGGVHAPRVAMLEEIEQTQTLDLAK